jgi:hypothetical protein
MTVSSSCRADQETRNPTQFSRIDIFFKMIHGTQGKEPLDQPTMPIGDFGAIL